MSWLRSIFGKRLPNSEQVLERGMELLQHGQAVEAVAQMKHCVDEIREASGVQSLPHAAALFHYGTLVCATGDYEQGAGLCRQAADASPDTHAGKKDRLTYLMNVGQLLSHGGQAEQAVTVLQTSLEERVEFYGEGHAGVAYGQQVLAEAMLASGQYEEGLRHARSAAATFEAERHHEFPGTFALRAALASAAGLTTDNIWQGLADYPEEVVTETVNHAYRTATLMADRLGLTYLGQLSDWCEIYMPEAKSLRINTLVTWSNLASDREDLEDMQRAADQLAGAIDLLDDADDRIQLRQGMAMSYSRCQRPPDEIRAVYQQAADEAEQHALPLAAAAVARNWAVFEAECECEEAALEKYEHAIRFSREAGSNGLELLGRTLIAKGIFLQHHEHREEAKPLLEEGIGLLPATHSDAACGVLHQVALENGLNCSCHGGEALEKQTLSLLAKKFFEQSGLSDLLESVDFGDDGLQIHLRRKPKPEELERLQIAHGVFTSQLKSAN